MFAARGRLDTRFGEMYNAAGSAARRLIGIQPDVLVELPEAGEAGPAPVTPVGCLRCARGTQKRTRARYPWLARFGPFAYTSASYISALDRSRA